jgi:hypothetical protein
LASSASNSSVRSVLRLYLWSMQAPTPIDARMLTKVVFVNYRPVAGRALRPWRPASQMCARAPSAGMHIDQGCVTGAAVASVKPITDLRRPSSAITAKSVPL